MTIFNTSTAYSNTETTKTDSGSLIALDGNGSGVINVY